MPVLLPNFIFPTPVYFDDTLPEVMKLRRAEELLELFCYSEAVISTHVKDLFRVIAVHFNTHASIGVIQTQASELASRFQPRTDIVSRHAMKGCLSGITDSQVACQSERGHSEVAGEEAMVQVAEEPQVQAGVVNMLDGQQMDPMLEELHLPEEVENMLEGEESQVEAEWPPSRRVSRPARAVSGLLVML